ncbi:alpha/beta fold hydrolase [Nonomuraea typhae]|uniref:Alpha/beta fold hydrolase n=1 Tax=Nonomuraea typhae TaxID=2603600 RepID=A0ABW7YYU7_9ACTN
MLAYADQGNGPATLFVHGVGTSSYLWRNVIAELRDERRCIAPDLPAHGGSPIQDDLSLPALADTLAGFCDELGLGQVDMVANDTGGAIAQLFAVRHPDKLRSLTLTNCDVHENTPPPGFLPTVELAAKGELLPLFEVLAQRPDLIRSSVYGDGYERIDDPGALVDAYVKPILAKPGGGRAFERFLAGIGPEEMVAIESQLTVLAVPTLVVWGTGDAFFGVEWARWLRDTIPGVREVVEIDGGRLFFPDERAGELVPHLRRFWG